LIERELDGWRLLESTPELARRRVLLLPGLFCTRRFFADLIARRELEETGVQMVAADPPGFAGLPALPDFDYSVPSYAKLVEALAEAESFDLVIGHSYFANVAIEVSGRGNYDGVLMLLSPCLRADNEEKDLRQLASLGNVPGVGSLAWLTVNPMLKRSMGGRLPRRSARRSGRRDETELARGQPAHPPALLRALRRPWESH
jgi:hypothetical protein